METKDLGKSSTGMEPNVAGLLCYLLGFITGIIFLVIEKENKFVRFHAMQSTITSAALFVLISVISVVFSFIPILGMVLNSLLGLLQLGLWIILMIKAYQGEYFKLPIVGDIAGKQLK